MFVAVVTVFYFAGGRVLSLTSSCMVVCLDSNSLSLCPDCPTSVLVLSLLNDDMHVSPAEENPDSEFITLHLPTASFIRQLKRYFPQATNDISTPRYSEIRIYRAGANLSVRFLPVFPNSFSAKQFSALLVSSLQS